MLPNEQCLWLFLFKYVFIFSGFCQGESDAVGTGCLQSNIPGVCRRVVDCPVALEKLKKHAAHGLDRCDFDGLMEVVCCPEKASGKEPTVNQPVGHKDKDKDKLHKDNRLQLPGKRKCQIACEKYTNTTDKLDGIGYHIRGGQDAANNEFPHMAALGYDSDDGYELLCGASIISPRFLLTAAHCFTSRVQPTTVRLGVTNLTDEAQSQNIEIRNVTLHSYSPISKQNDIALVELSREVVFTEKIFPACLYVEKNEPEEILVSGWGDVGNGSRSNVLQKAELLAYPRDQCNTTYFTRSFGIKAVGSTQLCAVNNGVDSCPGDSGGPLQVRSTAGIFFIIGIVSYGPDGCGGKQPSVYTRVTSYLDWIEEYVWP